MVIDYEAARRFLSTAYEPGDWIAIFLKSYETGRVAQRIVPVSLAMSPRLQAWMARENASAMNIFVSVNAVSPRQVSRRRSALAAIRHVFLDADENGPGVLATIAAQRDLPPPSYVLHSSPMRVHIFWRVASFTLDRVEALQQHLARALHTDRAATPGSQTTRLTGCWNHKTTPPSLVTVEYGDVDHVYTPIDFPTPVAMQPSRSPSPRSQAVATTDRVRERARRYTAAVPPAIAGRHGDAHTFRVCCRLVRGFALSDTDALGVLAEWNARCEPPWSDRELIAKLHHARHYGREPVGGLLEAQP